MDLEKYRRIFLQESEKYLHEIGETLTELENDPQDVRRWTELHGKVHSIKGMARAMSLETISRLAHEMEAWCLKFQKGAYVAREASMHLLFDGYAMLKTLVPRFGELDLPDLPAAYHRLLQALALGPEGGERGIGQASRESGAPITDPIDPIRTIGVPCSLIEELLGFSQELLLMEKSKPMLAPEFASVQGWIDHYAAMAKGLYFRLAQLRLMSIEDFVDLYRHTIHHQARSLGKSIRMTVAGGDIKADVALLDRLREPMIHIVRNAIAHGIESPQHRKTVGKPEEGTIRIEAESRREALVLRIADDGAGIRRESIERHLREKRGMRDEQIAGLDEKTFFETILSSDFSTASAADETAGRGIGMNVIAQAVSYLNGTLGITSKPGIGTTFTIELPMSLSVVHAVVFAVGPHILAVPTSSLDSAGYGISGIDVDTSPVLDLRKLFRVGIDMERTPGVLFFRRSADSAMSPDAVKAMMVDTILGNKPVMVMRAGQMVSSAGIFSGIGVLESGALAAMMDVSMVMRRFEKARSANPSR